MSFVRNGNKIGILGKLKTVWIQNYFDEFRTFSWNHRSNFIHRKLKNVNNFIFTYINIEFHWSGEKCLKIMLLGMLSIWIFEAIRIGLLYSITIILNGWTFIFGKRNFERMKEIRVSLLWTGHEIHILNLELWMLHFP